MDVTLTNLRKYFPFLPHNALIKIYKARCARLRLLMDKGMPGDIHWIIEAKVRLAGESSDSIVSYMPRMGKSSYSKRRRAKECKFVTNVPMDLQWRCRSLGMVSINREDKINFIKDESKESLDDILLTLETHPCGVVHRELLNLWHLFKDEQHRHSLGNLTLNDPACQFIRKLDGKHILTHRRRLADSDSGKDKEFLKASTHPSTREKDSFSIWGGSLGLMGTVSLAAHVEGSKVLNIIPKALTATNITGMTVGTEIQVSTMHERISKMLEKSDAFIALPWGYDTLEEIFQMLSCPNEHPS
ncbi:hypothetical protein FNV43_RR27015 [Rhamnella rubrinervis]|uniref:cytokinin riboside 5'-monophosphate phosphoribohydrolase n=1 Tax=Rhamnella rubrinervis TaxID=2594499 RepID=A0A8K0DKV3_9ROSA|nr:hypothetical protein FNV43_RR27015 [Rhamnella rubrinervis]